MSTGAWGGHPPRISALPCRSGGRTTACNRLPGANSDQITQDAQQTQAVWNQFIGAISKTKMLIDLLDGLKVAAAAAATFKPSSRSMSILVFEIAPINWFRVQRPPSPHSCQDRILKFNTNVTGTCIVSAVYVGQKKRSPAF